MALSKNCILNDEEINYKIRRIAYQIYECNVHENQVILAGIEKNGYILAERIKKKFEEISNIKGVLCAVKINKKKPINKVKTSLSCEQYSNKSVVLIDDVLHSGATLIYAVKHFLETPLKQIKTAVLVNRNHKKYPVKADFKGISLSTSINEHVDVEFKGNKSKVVLF